MRSDTTNCIPIASQTSSDQEMHSSQESMNEIDVDGAHVTGTSDIEGQHGHAPHTVPRLSPFRGHLPLHSLPLRRTRRTSLLAILVVFLLFFSIILAMVLLPDQGQFITAAQTTDDSASKTVGQVIFTSSGQLDPTSSQGLNDVLTVQLHDVTMPLPGKKAFAWLLPDATDDTTRPLLLGVLTISKGKAQLTYTHPEHENLLVRYSGFEVTEQPADQVPSLPSLDPKDRLLSGAIPNIPTPGDEQRYSLLSHLRHLLAQDPGLERIGVQGGMDIWLFRNAGKIIEWSTAARDSWSGGEQTDLIHRHMVRVLQYLDGTTYSYTSGDLPAGSPVLVDALAGRLGLLEVSPTQQLPSYLTHVDLHLNGLANSPEHTQDQKQLALLVDSAIRQDNALLKAVRQDAIKLVKMNTGQLKGSEALTLLNDMVTNAARAYMGQPDPKTGGYINGIVWVHSMVQGLATIPVVYVDNRMQR